MAVPCVNSLRRDYPDFVEYSNQRIPAQGVSLNLDEEFLVGCDCTDGCRVNVIQSSVMSSTGCFIKKQPLLFLAIIHIIMGQYA